MEHGEYWATGQGPDSDRAEDWREMLSATHLPWSTRVDHDADAPAFDAWVRRLWIDDLALIDCECGPCSGTRQRRHIAETDGEFVIVLMTRAGRETVSQGDAEAVLRAGDAVVWDSTKPAKFTVWEPLTKRSLLIPRAALEEVSGRAVMSAGVMLDGNRPATRLLTSYLDTLSTALPELDQCGVSAARNATLELFIGAMRSGGDTPTTSMAQPALRAEIDRYIERHLLDATTPADVAAAHGVSVRTVNRIFNATGQTVGEVIRVRRLARAREELTDSDQPVSSIAHRWGFSDPSHFTRSFKAHYGTSPRAYRSATRLAGGSRQVSGAVVQRARSAGRETGVTATRS
ncbi:helix-turn-helix domain-containing protein [Pseudonocardia sp. GCM10023141]|uniref:helix-turn-helix domain-containing protein n=1 Tax=Pseudonocardia sp. GCM10023141 TaxID=3252653 RepID=UPI00360FB94C